MLKLLPTPVPSSTGGTGMGSRHFLSRGVAPTTAGAAAANDARLTTSPTPPIAPRCTSCRLVNITPSLRAARKQAQRRRDIAECAAVQSMGLSFVTLWQHDGLRASGIDRGQRADNFAPLREIGRTER